MFILLMLSGVALIAVNAQNRNTGFQKVSSIDTVVDVHGDKYIFIRHDSIPLDYTNALTPQLPLLKRYTSYQKMCTMKEGEAKFFKMSGGMIPTGINYVTKIHNKEVIIDSHEKFREIFAPVETVQEAITFAYYIADSWPLYNLNHLVELPPIVDSIPPFKIELATGDTLWNIKRISIITKPIEEQWIIYTPEIISSYAVKVEDGYELLLYHYKIFGCEHPYIRRHIKVYFNGMVKIMDEQEAFQCLGDVGRCLD